ncbi:hypothetical protein NTJ12_002466 [Flavobacterium psychrophilum]|nr:hypothetical protein [Flavobacterium psychrophilum]
MSRLRYVKGNITEITGGTRKIFAKEGYEVHSNAQIINNAKGGKKHGEPDSPPIGSKPEIKPKCLVYFRPHDNYDGEYGFDWLRTGDTRKRGTLGLEILWANTTKAIM